MKDDVLHRSTKSNGNPTTEDARNGKDINLKGKNKVNAEQHTKLKRIRMEDVEEEPQ